MLLISIQFAVSLLSIRFQYTGINVPTEPAAETPVRANVLSPKLTLPTEAVISALVKPKLNSNSTEPTLPSAVSGLSGTDKYPTSPAASTPDSATCML